MRTDEAMAVEDLHAELRAEIASMVATHNSDVDSLKIQAAKIESGAKVIAALREALHTVKLYIADQMIANAVVVPPNEWPKGYHPTLMQVVDAALGDNEQTASKFCIHGVANRAICEICRREDGQS
jgi:hypothetical protein